MDCFPNICMISSCEIFKEKKTYFFLQREKFNIIILLPRIMFLFASMPPSQHVILHMLLPNAHE